MSEFAFVELALITPSKTNPRTHFDAAKLQELADDIKRRGIDTPVTVRPLPASRVADTSVDPATGKPPAVRPVYELVAGERRYRASRLAGVDTIPALVRDLDDEQALEVQLVENLHRTDLTELEEAEGYQRLMDHSHLSADQVADKIAMSRSYVYARLKLLDLTLECKQALRDGLIDASRALLIARIPDSKLQLKAIEWATKPDYSGDLPSVRRLQEWLKTNVMLKLEHAVFKLTDARLVEAAGSCEACPKRTGANPDLFADVASADICTDPACYHGKEEAHRAQLVRRAQAKGMRVVQDKEALEMLEGRGYRSKPPGYADLHTKRPDLTPEGETPITLAQAMGTDAPDPILFVHPRTQEVMELVEESAAAAVLDAKGIHDTRTFDKPEVLERELKHLQDRAQRSVDRATHTALYTATQQAIRKTTPADARQLLMAPELLRAFLFTELDLRCRAEEMAELLGYEFADGVDEMDALTAYIHRLGEAELMRAVVLCFLENDNAANPDTTTPILDALVKELDLDTKAIQRKAMATAKAEHANEIKALQARIDAAKAPPKAPVPLPPAARPAIEGGGAKPRKAGGKKAEAAAPKMSAEEASSGIAAAMQGLDGAASAPDGAVAPPDAGPSGQLVKYRCPQTLQTWSGRGLKPKWVQAHINNGGTLEDLLVDPVTPDTQAFTKNQAVRVTANTALLGPAVRKFAGRHGVIAKELGDHCYQVRMAKGGSVPMYSKQLEVVAA